MALYVSINKFVLISALKCHKCTHLPALSIFSNTGLSDNSLFGHPKKAHMINFQSTKTILANFAHPANCKTTTFHEEIPCLRTKSHNLPCRWVRWWHWLLTDKFFTELRPDRQDCVDNEKDDCPLTKWRLLSSKNEIQRYKEHLVHIQFSLPINEQAEELLSVHSLLLN